jgi:hypothetical protein
MHGNLALVVVAQYARDLSCRGKHLSGLPSVEGWLVGYRHFVTIGIKVGGNQVSTLTGRRLGQLAGAHELGEPTRHHRVAGPLIATAVTAPVLGPLAILGMASKKSKSAAFVSFADGTAHHKAIDGNSAISQCPA